ncbi:hypothetical protein B4Q13_18045 [Lacticaseibacillus rhamnosus]
MYAAAWFARRQSRARRFSVTFCNCPKIRRWPEAPETLGSGAAFLDVDNDGWQDILFVNSRNWPSTYTVRWAWMW